MYHNYIEGKLMEIVYLLTNKSKLSGKRFYIGSKSSCKIIKINGVKTMVDINSGKPYYSSSTSFEFKDDIKSGNVFEVEILQKVPMKDRKRLVEIENQWIIEKNAVGSDEYYNLGYALLNCRDQGKLANKYGETVGDLAKNNSSASKRDNTAKQVGFNNFGELCFYAYNEYLKSKNWSDVARGFNRHKGFIRMMLGPFDMDKATLDLKTVNVEKIRELLSQNCSLSKACEILNVELPAGRVALGEYIKDRNYSVAFNQGKTKKELELEITREILDGKGFHEVAALTGVTVTSVKRYFFRCIRSNFKSSDLKN